MADRKLGAYRHKREFDRTPEPTGDEETAAAGTRFVVQEHHARRLHWDLRLERDGALVSWALPRGIPQHPNDNRLAVHTEDHPLEYLSFEGTIPKGEYGAGEMRVWDAGTYVAEKFDPKKVVVELRGERVRGRYALFHTRDDDWMIHRMDPPEAGREPMPEGIEPMKATLAELPKDEGAYGYEIKWDGVRAIAYCSGGHVRLESRNLRDITAQYPEIRGLGRQLGARDAVLDGELVALDEEDRPSFQRLQRRMHLADAAVIGRRAREAPVTYMLFDLLYLDGESTMPLPFDQRRVQLEQLGLAGDRWQTPSYHRGEGRALLGATREQGLEGIVAKRLDSPYVPGRRSAAWLKVKNVRAQEVVIGGWVPGKGRREEMIGALLAGYYDDGELRYAGKVGTGFTEDGLRRLAELLEAARRPDSPFAGRQPPRDAVFADPRLVAEVEFNEWTKTGTMRHPSFKGLRDDKDPREVGREEPAEAPSLADLDEVLYPAAGFTKGDVIDYYVRAGPALLPLLRERPLTLKRYPNGVEGRSVDQQQPVEDLPTLERAASLACLEIHAALTPAPELDRPTTMVFDLDPGDGLDVIAAARVAILIRDMLTQLGADSVVKTTGSRGLHVHVPLNTAVSYDDTRPFAQAVARLLEKQHPDLVVSGTTKRLRRDRVLVDWRRNSGRESTVCAFSLRARERPTVATPVSWEEVTGAVEANQPDRLRFEAPGVLEQLDSRAELFRPLLELEQRLPDLG